MTDTAHLPPSSSEFQHFVILASYFFKKRKNTHAGKTSSISFHDPFLFPVPHPEGNCHLEFGVYLEWHLKILLTSYMWIPIFFCVVKMYFIDVILCIFFLWQTNNAINSLVPFSLWNFCKSFSILFLETEPLDWRASLFFPEWLWQITLQIPMCKWSHGFISALILKLLGFWIFSNWVVIKYFSVLIYLSLISMYIEHLLKNFFVEK